MGRCMYKLLGFSISYKHKTLYQKRRIGKKAFLWGDVCTKLRGFSNSYIHNTLHQNPRKGKKAFLWGDVCTNCEDLVIYIIPKAP